jgi:signal peptidase I
MSPRARRYFGCVLPVALIVFGCATVLLLGYAGQVLVQVERVPDDTMAPLLKPGWTVVVNNMGYWAADPDRGHIVTVSRPGGWAIRRVVALPGESVAVTDGQVYIDGRLRDPGYTPHGRGPDFGPFTVPADHVFLVADDRDAEDSRQWGAASRDDLFGLVVFQVGPDRRFDPVLVTATPTPAPATTTAPTPVP